MDWYEKPQKIIKWDKDIDYFMFVDENGTPNRVGNLLNKIINKKTITIDEKYFTITGCIFTKTNFIVAREKSKELKRKFWNNGMFFDNKNNKERFVCFHSREIRRHDNAFNDIFINHNEFTNELTKFLKSVDCIIISITIDLEKYIINNYKYNIYETAFDFLLERYIYATGNNKKGVIMLEARGKDEDKKLLKHIYDVITKSGRKNIKPMELKNKIKGIYFNPKWNDEFTSTYIGLEIADLFSYPIHQYVKLKKENPAFLVLETKIYGFPNYKNKGVKIFP